MVKLNGFVHPHFKPLFGLEDSGPVAIHTSASDAAGNAGNPRPQPTTHSSSTTKPLVPTASKTSVAANAGGATPTPTPQPEATTSTSRSSTTNPANSPAKTTSTPTATAHPQPSHGSSGLSGGALIAAIVVPIVVVFLLVVLGIFFCRRRRRRNYYYDGSSTDVQEIREEPKSNFAGGAPMNFPDSTAMQDNSHLGDQRGISDRHPQSNEPFLPSAGGQHTAFGGYSRFSKEHGDHTHDQRDDDEVSAIDEDEDYNMPEDEHATVGVAQRASVVPMGSATTPHEEHPQGYRPG